MNESPHHIKQIPPLLGAPYSSEEGSKDALSELYPLLISDWGRLGRVACEQDILGIKCGEYSIELRGGSGVSEGLDLSGKL